MLNYTGLIKWKILLTDIDADPWVTSLTRFRKDDVIRNQDSICGILSGLAPRCHHHRDRSPSSDMTSYGDLGAYPCARYSWTPLCNLKQASDLP